MIIVSGALILATIADSVITNKDWDESLKIIGLIFSIDFFISLLIAGANKKTAR